MHSAQLQALRRMTAYEKLCIAGQLWETAWRAKAAHLRKITDWTEEQVLREVRRLFGHAGA